MNSKHHRLLQDLHQDEVAGRRASTLQSGARVLRYRRFKRLAATGLAAVPLLGVLAWQVHTLLAPRHQPQVAANSAPAASPKVERITDAELLGLFPGTPVVLMKLNDGREKLVFLKAEDQARYAGQL